MKNRFFIALLTIAVAFGFGINKTAFSVSAEVADAVGTLNSELKCEGAKSAFLCDYSSGTVIYAKNENDRLPIASMTKIMLLVLAFEKESTGELSFDEVIKVSENASGMGGSQVFLEANGEYHVGDLIKSIIVSSANDSSVAIAERLYGSETSAVIAMNDKAKAMGLKNTLFSNCTGLMKPTQYSSASDVAKMLSALVEYEKYFDYSKIYLDEIEHSGERKTQLTNTNKLIRYYNGCDGGKTGYTGEAGFCLAATAKRGSMRLISVVMGEENGKQRFKDSSTLLDYGFDNYFSKCVLSTATEDYQTKISCGKADYVNAVPSSDVYVFCENSAKDDIKIMFEPNENIKAPVEKGASVGTFTVYKNGVAEGEYSAVAKEDVGALGYFDYIKRIVES